MKIVFNTYFRDKMGGGLGRVAYEIVQSFAEKHEVLFIVPGDNNHSKKVGNLTHLYVKSSGEGEVVFPLLNIKTIKYIFAVLNKFKPNIIHCHDPGPVGFLLQSWAITNNTPFFYTSHVLPTKIMDFNAKEVLEGLSKFFDKVLVKKYNLVFFNNCDGVIALNLSAKKDIIKAGYKGKIFTIPNGRNLSLYNRPKLVKLSDGKINLLFVGHLTVRKNQVYLLKAMRFLPSHFELTLIGEALQKKSETIMHEYCQKYKLNVKFAGKVDHSEIPIFLQKTHFFVSASKMEVQSLVIMEALASGTPVIGLSNETIDEFIDNTNGFCFPKITSPKTFADKIKKLSQMPESKYNELFENARKKVEYYDWKNIRKMTEDAYIQVINESKSNKIEKQKRLSVFIDELTGSLQQSKNKNLSSRKVLLGFKKRNLFLYAIIAGCVIASSWYFFVKKNKNLRI